MRPTANLALQVAALVASVLLRSRWGGWETLIFVLSVIGPVLLLVPTLLAVSLLRHGRLRWPLWVPFAGMAASMLVVCVFYGAYSDTDEPYIPLFELLGLPGRRSEWDDLTNQIGSVGMWSFAVFLIWVLIAVSTSLNKPGPARVERQSARIG